MISPGNGERNGHLQGVILDMDGVIIDSHPAHRRAWQNFLASSGKSVSETELNYILDGRKRSEILRHFFGELSEQEIVEYGNRKDEFFQRASLEVTPIPGVLDFLKQMKQQGIALAVATSASRTRTRSTLWQLRLTRGFKVIITGDDVREGKPDPAIYRVACQGLGILPEHALAIEDAMSGIRAAKGAGICCVAVAGHESADQLRDAGADHVIENFVGLTHRHLQVVLRRNGCNTSSPQGLAHFAL
jgi:beta-phosphoglucomutase